MFLGKILLIAVKIKHGGSLYNVSQGNVQFHSQILKLSLNISEDLSSGHVLTLSSAES